MHIVVAHIPDFIAMHGHLWRFATEGLMCNMHIDNPGNSVVDQVLSLAMSCADWLCLRLPVHHGGADSTVVAATRSSGCSLTRCCRCSSSSCKWSMWVCTADQSWKL
mmetsp:Transcript_74679/g.175273  ORF Transcript_74679/g.175273 Transcript_74679/m.175273 type:complete len:107 (-) Transcript_74679:534-854(-)